MQCAVGFVLIQHFESEFESTRTFWVSEFRVIFVFEHMETASLAHRVHT